MKTHVTLFLLSASAYARVENLLFSQSWVLTKKEAERKIESLLWDPPAAETRRDKKQFRPGKVRQTRPTVNRKLGGPFSDFLTLSSGLYFGLPSLCGASFKEFRKKSRTRQDRELSIPSFPKDGKTERERTMDKRDDGSGVFSETSWPFRGTRPRALRLSPAKKCTGRGRAMFGSIS